jgi:LuxR family quorum sensing-dependent transcriptional regulator
MVEKISKGAVNRSKARLRSVGGHDPAPTRREVEVLTWVAKGKSAWEIGEILNITKRTVDEHVRIAVQKIGAANRTHAVALAIKNELIKI